MAEFQISETCTQKPKLWWVAGLTVQYCTVHKLKVTVYKGDHNPEENQSMPKNVFMWSISTIM